MQSQPVVIVKIYAQKLVWKILSAKEEYRYYVKVLNYGSL